MKQDSTNTQLLKHIVSDSITVSDGVRPNEKSIHSSSKWFTEEYYTINDDGECLTITKCYMEIPKTAYKFSKSKNFRSLYLDIPNGKYNIDKDSTEDELVIYYR